MQRWQLKYWSKVTLNSEISRLILLSHTVIQAPLSDLQLAVRDSCFILLLLLFCRPQPARSNLSCENSPRPLLLRVLSDPVAVWYDALERLRERTSIAVDDAVASTSAIRELVRRPRAYLESRCSEGEPQRNTGRHSIWKGFYCAQLIFVCSQWHFILLHIRVTVSHST